MLKFLIMALVTLELVLLSALVLPPADAASSDFENYIWGFASAGSNQLVCKKVAMQPDQWWQPGSSKNQAVKMYSTSTVVSDRYCANSAKPYPQVSQSH